LQQFGENPPKYDNVQAAKNVCRRREKIGTLLEIKSMADSITTDYLNTNSKLYNGDNFK
jgi:hypothetical protein